MDACHPYDFHTLMPTPPFLFLLALQRRKLLRQTSRSSSLHSSFDEEGAGSHAGGVAAGGGGSLSNSREMLAPLKSSASFNKTSPLGQGAPLSKLPSPLPSGSGSDWPTLGAPPQHLGTLKVSAYVGVLAYR